MSQQNLMKKVMRSMERCHQFDGKPFHKPEMIQSHSSASSHYSSHYGIMIPDLGKDLGFLDIVLVLGQAGIFCMDEPDRFVDRPDQTLSLLSANPAMDEHLHKFYSMPKDCTISEDGTHIQIDQVLNLTGDYPNFSVSLKHAGFEVDLDIHNSDQVSWFSRVPGFYSHIGLLSRFKGEVRINGQSQQVSGDCSFEYAAGLSPYTLPKPLAKKAMGRMRYFNYQVITLSSGYQLLVTLVKTRGGDIKRAAWLKSQTDSGIVFEHVNFEILEARNETCPDGRVMQVPVKWKWLMSKGNQDVVINGQLTTPYYYGLGRGFAGGFELEGFQEGKPVTGKGYIEYIDCLSL